MVKILSARKVVALRADARWGRGAYAVLLGLAERFGFAETGDPDAILQRLEGWSCEWVPRCPTCGERRVRRDIAWP